MKIFIDGCDGSGKSTLAKYLSDKFKLDIFCLTKDSEKSVSRYYELLNIDNVIYDRTFLSEVVYPKVFGREEWIADKDVSDLLDEYKCDDTLFVICTAPEDVIKERLSVRGNEYSQVINNIDYINESYRQIAINNDLFLINTYAYPLEAIGYMIERRLKKW